MGVETLLYNAKNWVKGNKYEPVGNALVYVRIPVLSNQIPVIKFMYASNRRLITAKDYSIENLVFEDIDVVNLGRRINPFFVRNFLNNTCRAYESMCSSRRQLMAIKEEPEEIMRLFKRFERLAEDYFSHPNEPERQRIIYAAELVSRQIPFNNEFCNFMLDLYMKDRKSARSRIREYSAFLQTIYQKP